MGISAYNYNFEKSKEGKGKMGGRKERKKERMTERNRRGSI
jgi:hypothetical protein